MLGVSQSSICLGTDEVRFMVLGMQCITGLNYNYSMRHYHFFPTLSLMTSGTKRKCSLIGGFIIVILFIAIDTVGNSDFSYRIGNKRSKTPLPPALDCPAEFPSICCFAEANMLSLVIYFC